MNFLEHGNVRTHCIPQSGGSGPSHRPKCTAAFPLPFKVLLESISYFPTLHTHTSSGTPPGVFWADAPPLPPSRWTAWHRPFLLADVVWDHLRLRTRRVSSYYFVVVLIGIERWHWDSELPTLGLKLPCVPESICILITVLSPACNT